MTSKSYTGFDPAIENRRLDLLFLMQREARRKEGFHTITDFTLLQVVTPNNRCNFLKIISPQCSQ